MTRETKIGLLVGLAFIIVIGILLSEHLTTASEPPTAALAQAGGNVRQGMATPGGVSAAGEAGLAGGPVGGPVGGEWVRSSGGGQTGEAGPIPTRSDLSPAGPGPVTILGPVTRSGEGREGNSDFAAGGEAGPVVSRVPAGGSRASANLPADLRAAAARYGESLVPVASIPVSARASSDVTGPDGSRGSLNSAASASDADARQPATSAREYTAKPGDTLSRIASLLPGGNSRANRDAIARLNPSLQKDPNRVIAGRTYLLPASAMDASTAVASARPAPGSSGARRPAADAPRRTRPAEVYVVQPGDNLTRIAISQLGSAEALPLLRELNKDLLNGSDMIRPDMKLKLPPREVARGE